MPKFPETKLSLIMRLPGKNLVGTDQAAWQQFAATYEPFLMRYAVRRGLQHADAEELVQGVMVAVAKNVDRWQPASTSQNERPKFRNWLFTIARNQLINYLKKSNRNMAVGGTTQLRQLASAVDSKAPDPAGWDEDFQREVFLWAAARVKAETSASTWDAFWQTAVLGRSCTNVARSEGVSVGSIYVARSRILARLRAQVETLGSTSGGEKPSASEFIPTRSDVEDRS